MEHLLNALGEFLAALGASATDAIAKDERQVDKNSLYGRLAGLVAGIMVVGLFGAMIGGVLYISFVR